MALTGYLAMKRTQEKTKSFLETRDENWALIDDPFHLFTHMSEEIGE